MLAFLRDVLRVLVIAYLLKAVLWFLPKDDAGRAFSRAIADYAEGEADQAVRRWDRLKVGLR